MKVKLVDAVLPFHPLLRHPRTGLPLRAAGQRADGSYLWPILGADGEDDAGGEDDGDSDADDADDADDDDADEGGDDKKKSKSKKVYSAEEYEELQRKYEARTKHLAASDKNKSAAEKELAALKRKDQSELEKVTGDLKTVTEERDSYQSKFTTLARTNAFLIASAQEKITWHDPSDAQAVGASRFKDLEIDEDGNIDGIRDVVKKLAKDKPHLVNKSTDEGDEDNKKNGSKRGASGSGVGSKGNNNGKGNKGTPSKEELVSRFPGLRR
jgi:hypothetical protein